MAVRTHRGITDIILGRPLASSEAQKQTLTVLTGLPALGLDALASTAYGPEAALTVLAPLGEIGLHRFPFIVLAVVGLLAALYFSYRQTTAAYPNGAGVYAVAKDNLGSGAAVCAAVALLMDYLLNVAVGIAAGVGAVVSAIPALHPHTLELCLAVLIVLMTINLRGVRESGLVFVIPVFIFVAFLGIAVGIGVVRAFEGGGMVIPKAPPPPLSPATAGVSTWVLLGAFANGCTAMTGVEAVSNAVPLFRPPTVRNAQRTLTLIVGILGLLLLVLGYLCPAYHIGAMDERAPGYQTVLSQLVAAATGRGAFYYVTLASIFVVLTCSAQTSFVDFPRVCRMLAEDRFLPSAFANRGRRLVYSYGIVVLTVVAGILLVIFRGLTEKLIPLFAVGAFSGFLLSQVGMVLHWARRRGHGSRAKLACNALGAVTTGVALVIIIVAKFVEGAWVVVVVAPSLVFLLWRIRRHYDMVARQVDTPLAFTPAKLEPPVVIVPVDGWNRVAERALRLSLSLSDDITALHVRTEGEDKAHLRRLWAEKVEAPAKGVRSAVPRLEIVDSPYRRIYKPILDFVAKTKKTKPGRLIAVVIPELAEAHWYEYLLHNLHGAGLKALLFLKGDNRTIVVSVPWYWHDV